MDSSNLNKLFQFTSLLNKLRAVKRTIYIPHTKEKENDVEHSYHLAMLAWYIANTHALEFDREKLLMYALIHDMVEVYAGDSFLYSTDQALHDSKMEREASALLQIEKEFPEFVELQKAITAYEKKEDKESRFVYALDKIHPVLQIYLDDGIIWRESNITLAMLLAKKNDKIALSPELAPYWDEFVTILKQNEERLFIH